MNLKDYSEFNRTISSEMFYSIMAILHDRLPCAPNFFRLKRIYKTKVRGLNINKS